MYLITNTREVGSLLISKRVSGSGASTKTLFNFTVNLFTVNEADEKLPLSGTYLVEIFNKNETVPVRTAYVSDGKGQFQLSHNQFAVIENIPVGVNWEVSEEKSSGYSSSAETPNNGVISEDQSVSAWKNFRSNDPPIPKTGYGDGTTVKVGLLTSLSVFLTSVIGIIIEDKNEKKKKQGKGSHATKR